MGGLRKQNSQSDNDSVRSSRSDTAPVISPPVLSPAHATTANIPPPPLKPTLSADANNQQERLKYVLSHMDSIPDVRDVRMHVGLPLPENELESLLSFACLLGVS